MKEGAFMSIVDSLTYFYIKRIKRWIQCPVCNHKLLFSKNSISWCCNHCGYSLKETEFLDDYVFWFCDCCGTYLNIQNGFNRNGLNHICEKCGFNNDTTFSNIKGECRDCRKLLDNPNATICDDCKTYRLEKAKEFFDNVAEVCDQASSALKNESNENEDTEPKINTNELNILAKDFSDGATCPICNSDCYWDEDKCTWICDSCNYEIEGSQIEYDSENDKVKVLGIDWYCDNCNSHLNSQHGFKPYDDSWKCTKCGYENSLTKDNVLD